MKQADRDIIALLGAIRDAGAAAETDPLALHSVLVGKTVFVDSVNGNDATAVRGRLDKPFATYAGGRAALQEGDRMTIAPGHSESLPSSVLGSGLNMDVTFQGPVVNIGAGDAFYNGGDYTWSVNSELISAENLWALWGSFNLFANRIKCTTGPAISWPLREPDTAFYSYIRANVITATKIVEPYLTSFTDAAQASIPSSVFIKAVHLISTSAANTAIDWTAGANNVIDEEELPVATADRVIWVEALLINSAGAVAGIYSPQSDGTKLYITAQKALGAGALAAIAVEAGKLWSNIDKLTSSHIFLSLTGGESWHDIRLLEVGTTAAQFAINCTGGTHVIKNARFIGGASNKGVNVTGGTLILENCHIDTSANATTNPITKSGGTLILKNCSLVAEGTRDSITAGTAQNVKVYGTSVANKAKHANVTIQVGTLTVSTDVT